MRLVFAGTPEPAVVALRALLDSPHEVVAVLTRPDAPRGRGRTLHPSPVKALAVEQGIEVLTPATLKPSTEEGQALRDRLRELAPEAIPVVAYGNLVTTDLLQVVPHGWINLHFSLLPRWRGAAPVQAAIRAGDRATGVTTFRIDEGLDTGPVLASRNEEIRAHDTADDLLTRLAHRGADLLADTMTGLEAGTLRPHPQEGPASYAPKITTEDARVNWLAPAEEIARAIRAHTPAPGAWTTWGERRFKVAPVEIPLDTGVRDLEPGRIVATKKEVLVGTGTDPVRLTRLQPPGKKMMAAADWARGAQPKEGTKFQ
ncbi:methionyl-tRNA formyltransferase [Corynebacterium sp. zg-331]|uniref:methionyl-tRNA formyltransferase n=1 Tax=unclassified Corynebacterium TaxID=2624378 RepID=UPI00128E32E2|nr:MULTISPECIES: methionyl-tRNA formyltransferase [unclassified Corynebacterium]MBC3185490.1 methionyl-tRNA formyltransferase [Corynebacterium sp. zg-331]MPV51984.1 methionyl-tRNA formyltransferase [Corynebacterium sp. zg331]